METLPPTQKWEEKWASISGSVPCWGSHTGVSTARAALKAQKAALGSNQLSTETLSTETLTTLVSNLTFHFPKFLGVCSLLKTLVYAECIRSSSELEGFFRVPNKHLSSLSCNPSYQPLNQLQDTFTKCMFSPPIKATLRISQAYTVLHCHIRDSNWTNPLSVNKNGFSNKFITTQERAHLP